MPFFALKILLLLIFPFTDSAFTILLIKIPEKVGWVLFLVSHDGMQSRSKCEYYFLIMSDREHNQIANVKYF